MVLSSKTHSAGLLDADTIYDQAKRVAFGEFWVTAQASGGITEALKSTDPLATAAGSAGASPRLQQRHSEHLPGPSYSVVLSRPSTQEASVVAFPFETRRRPPDGDLYIAAARRCSWPTVPERDERSGAVETHV